MRSLVIQIINLPWVVGVLVATWWQRNGYACPSTWDTFARSLRSRCYSCWYTQPADCPFLRHSQIGFVANSSLLPARHYPERSNVTALLYGGIGFLPHILTYYAVACLSSGKAPVLPRSGKNLKNGGADVLLSALGMIDSVIVSGFNISACRSRWQFVCIGLCSLSCHPSLLLWSHLFQYPDIKYDFNRESKAEWWLVIYEVGTCVGMAGLLSLVSQKFDEQLSIGIITGIFASLAAIFPAIQIWSHTDHGSCSAVVICS